MKEASDTGIGNVMSSVRQSTAVYLLCYSIVIPGRDTKTYKDYKIRDGCLPLYSIERNSAFSQQEDHGQRSL